MASDRGRGGISSPTFGLPPPPPSVPRRVQSCTSFVVPPYSPSLMTSRTESFNNINRGSSTAIYPDLIAQGRVSPPTAGPVVHPELEWLAPVGQIPGPGGPPRMAGDGQCTVGFEWFSIPVWNNIGPQVFPGQPPNFAPPFQSPADITPINKVRGPSESPTDNLLHPMVMAGFDDRPDAQELDPFSTSEDKDLIKFSEDVVKIPENEYLTLEFFDPLKELSRPAHLPKSTSTDVKEANFSDGIAIPNFVTNSSIGLNPIGLEAFGGINLGSSDEGHTASSLTSAAYDVPSKADEKAPKPQRPPPFKVPQGKQYERLIKRSFIDPESESFCRMVADLKKMYLSTDEKTNQGYLVNQIRECHMASIQVKLIVHCPSTDRPPLTFTCDTNTLVEHVISHVLCTLDPDGDQLDTDEYLIKVYDRTEYFCNDLPLAKFDYTHTCLKLDCDIVLELVKSQVVTRPFIRTRDDDGVMLYFPKEYINADGTAIAQEKLADLLDTFYHEMDVMVEHFTKGGTSTFHTQGLLLSVKALCLNLAKVETTDIIKALGKLERNVAELMNPASLSQKYGSSRHRDVDTQEAISVAERYSLIEDLQDTIGQLVDAVKKLVRMYCRTFLTDYFLGSSVEIPHDHKEVVLMEDNFIACISSAHRIPEAWTTKFEEYKVVCSLYHGTKRLIPDISTTVKSLTSGMCERIIWDEWLQFDLMSLSIMPRETRLIMVLCGLRTPLGNAEKSSDKGEVTEGNKVMYPLGAATMQLFNENGHLLQGPQLIPLVMGIGSDPIMPSCKTVHPDSVFLQVNLPDFERTIFFPEPLNTPQSPTKSFDELSPMIKNLVFNVMEKESCATFSPEELEILWRHRHYMRERPSLLPRILMAAHHWDCASLGEIYSLLRHWKSLHPIQAFELLLPQFPDRRVREFAADSLNRIQTDDLIDFLPQMIQGLKFESYHNSPLAKLLLEQSCKSPRFAHQFFWLLKGVAAQETTFKRRYELMFVALACVVGDSLYQEFRKQEVLIKMLNSVAEKVCKAKDKDAVLRRELVPVEEMLKEKGRVLLPYNPSVEVVGLDLQSCSYFTSKSTPLKLVFRNSNPRADGHYVIYKVGDDLRQDMLTLQMIHIMDSLWLQQGLDLRMVTFACLATGPKKGIIELITKSDTLRKIQVSDGITGSLKSGTIKEWLQKHNSTELAYKKAMENFMYSCAGYCVATYVLGVCDRHNDNIMLKQSGHMFHIDFSKFLGDAEMFGAFKRDRVPFVLTADMAYVINDGSKNSERFQHFIDLCCQAFNILRKHADLFRSLFILMMESGIPNVNESAVRYVQTTLLPGQSDAQATSTFTRMIEESLTSLFTVFNFIIHNFAQRKFANHTEGQLLSFVPKVYSKKNDGKISSVELVTFQKRYTTNKQYIFILKLERENQTVPTFIFRYFSEFEEFRNKLAELFPLVTWPNFSTRIWRSNVRTVAESRKTEITDFLKCLMSKAAEISECDLVYTFFHSMYRDEQEAGKSYLNLTKLKEAPVRRITNSGNSGIQGDLKLSIQYKHDALQVMVMHVRGLPEASQLPSPYVKIYLLPDASKQTKMKTKVVKNTSHPTFNELLLYQLPHLEICHRILQVTVWDWDMLKENNFLGAVYIKLRELDLTKDNTTWYKLGRIQM